MSTLPRDNGQMAQWQWGPPSDPTDDDGHLSSRRFADRALAELIPVVPLLDSQGDDQTEIASVQEDEFDTEQSASSDDEPGGNIDLESRLSDHRSLAPDIDSSLPADYNPYQKAVLTGFVPFEWRSFSEPFALAYKAMREGITGEGDPGEGLCQVEGQMQEFAYFNRVTNSDEIETYQVEILSDDLGQDFRIEVTNSADELVKLFSLTTNRVTNDDSFRRELSVWLPQYGAYDMISTRDELDVKFKSFSNPRENGFHFKYRRADRDIQMSGHIPEWQGPPVYSHP